MADRGFKPVFRLIPLGGPKCQEMAAEIKKIINEQWGDRVIEGSGEGSADYDVAIIFGDILPVPVGVVRGAKKVEDTDLESLVEASLKLAFDEKLKARLNRTLPKKEEK